MSLGDRALERVGAVFLRAELGDPRRVRRAAGLAESFARAPDKSLPKIWSTEAELEAGYRFLRSPHTTFERLMEPVQLAAREEALKARSVLVLHDTTDISCPAAKPEEVGRLQTNQPGFFVHHVLCVTNDEDTRPLGVLWSQLWGRAERSKGRVRKLTGTELSKQEERESDCWLESVTEAHLWAEGCQVVHVMDREGDSYRLFEHLDQLNADFVVRMRHNRRVDDGHVADVLAAEPIKLRRLVPITARKSKSIPRYTHKGRAAREVELCVRCATVEIQPPPYLGDSSPLQLQVVQVLEENAPAGEQPIAWMLITSLPVKTRREAEQVIDIYRARWTIEEFHKALKTGCMFEKRQLESFESITNLLAICYPIACELLRIRSRARQSGIPAHDVLSPTLLTCLRAHPKAKRLSENPSAEEALAAIAGLGGHLKQNGPPGWQSLAAGYMNLLAFEQGWLAAMAAQNL